MKKRLTSTATKIVLCSILALFVASVIPVQANPLEPHNADAMWVEPSSVTLGADTALGYKFNVTVWLNISSADVFGYQIALKYNRTQLRCARSAFTAGALSQFMSGHDTQTSGPTIDTSFLGNGSILAFESCKGEDVITRPKVDSLIWAEFEVILAPEAGEILTSEFDLETETARTPPRNWVKNLDLAIIPLTASNGDYTFVPEFSSSLISLIFVITTLIIVALTRKRVLKPIGST